MILTYLINACTDEGKGVGIPKHKYSKPGRQYQRSAAYCAPAVEWRRMKYLNQVNMG